MIEFINDRINQTIQNIPLKLLFKFSKILIAEHGLNGFFGVEGRTVQFFTTLVFYIERD